VNHRGLSFVGLLLVACGSTSEAPPPVGSTPLPCDVDAVLAKNCRSCHSSPAKYGAPMPLTSWEAVHAKAASNPGVEVWELMKARVHDKQNPMPASGMLGATDLATLDAWFAASAPKGTASCSDAGVVETKEGPAYLPCPEAQQTRFVAHGDGGAKFSVPADAGNLYECFYFKSPFTTPTQATAFAPIIDDTRVVHHWILFETPTPQKEGTYGPCKMPLDAQFISGWAPGGGNKVMPDDVGMKLPGGDRWLILQLHYWNVAGHKDSKDQSGVAMCTTEKLRPHTAVISTLGSANIDLPPKSANVEVKGKCTPNLTEPIHVLASSPHMHGRGHKFTTKVLRGGDPAKAETLVDVPRFDFNAQQSYDAPKDMLLAPGDTLETTCVYDNPGSTSVFFGEKTEDEMCFNFVLAWPESGIVNAGGAAARRCIDK